LRQSARLQIEAAPLHGLKQRLYLPAQAVVRQEVAGLIADDDEIFLVVQMLAPDIPDIFIHLDYELFCATTQITPAGSEVMKSSDCFPWAILPPHIRQSRAIPALLYADVSNIDDSTPLGSESLGVDHAINTVPIHILRQ
jgi:hypothetical protein